MKTRKKKSRNGRWFFLSGGRGNIGKTQSGLKSVEHREVRSPFIGGGFLLYPRRRKDLLDREAINKPRRKSHFSKRSKKSFHKGFLQERQASNAPQNNIFCYTYLGKKKRRDILYKGQ